MEFDLGHMISSLSNLVLRTKRSIDKDDSSINYEFYKNYIPNIQERDTIFLNSDGFKLLIHEALSPIIENELGMKYLGNGYWATDYDNHCRKVLQLFKINNAYATFSWGYNFDFAPKKSGQKLVNARTDKQICSHTFEVSTDFYKHTANRDKTVISSFGGNIDDFNNSISKMKKKYIEVFNYLLPTIKSYYNNTNSYQNILKNMEKMWNTDHYYRFVNPEMIITKCFVKAFCGNKEEALNDFEKLNFDSNIIKQAYLSKLNNI